MSAKERREHLERAVADGGTIMTARGTLTRTVPSSSALARTPAERRAARDDLERRMLALQQEHRRLEEDNEGERFIDRLDVEEDAGADRGRQRAGARTIEARAGEKDNEDDAVGDLPQEYPGREVLIAAGYTTLTAVNGLSRDELIALDGIGPVTADKIISLRPKK